MQNDRIFLKWVLLCSVPEKYKEHPTDFFKLKISSQFSGMDIKIGNIREARRPSNQDSNIFFYDLSLYLHLLQSESKILNAKFFQCIDPAQKTSIIFIHYMPLFRLSVICFPYIHYDDDFNNL